MKCAPVAWRRLAGPVRTAAAGDCVWRPCCTYRLLCLSVRPSLSLFLSFSLCLSVSLSLWMARTSTGSSACAQQPAPLEQAPIPPKSASIHAAGPTPTCSGPLEVAMRPIRDARACFLCVATANGGPLLLWTPNFGGLLHFWTWRKNKSCCHVLISEYRPTNVLSQDSPSRSSQSFL